MSTDEARYIEIDKHLGRCRTALEDAAYALVLADTHLSRLRVLNDTDLFDGQEGPDAISFVETARRHLRGALRIIVTRAESEGDE